MLSPFMKLGRSYIDIRSIERMKRFDDPPSVSIWFKHTRGEWNYKGEKYDIDEIAKRIEAFYRQIPKHKEEELERFEILDL
jgi:hypothetical protein